MASTTDIEALYDVEAEEALIGGMLLNRDTADHCAEMLAPDHFYSPLNGRVFGAIQDLIYGGFPVDAVAVTDLIGGESKDQLGSQLLGYMNNTPSSAPHSGAHYANIVLKHYSARMLAQRLADTTAAVMAGDDPYETAAELEKFIDGMGNIHSSQPESLTLEEMLALADETANVVIPGMLYSDYRTIVVGEEGTGKSVILRTIGMCAAQGIHPFSHHLIEPQRVLIVDLENPRQAVLETALPLGRVLMERGSYSSERLRFWRKPGGIDIRKLSDRAELQREIAFHKPTLVCIGPVYKLYQRRHGESYEDSTDEAMQVLDHLRTKYEFALLMEHHAPKGKPGEKRELTPFGSQRWLAWPEIGISLRKDKNDPTILNVSRYRGDRLMGVEWPDNIVRDKTWLIDGQWEQKPAYFAGLERGF